MTRRQSTLIVAAVMLPYLAVGYMATVAQGGVQVQLVPTPNLAAYPPSSVVQVDVKLAQAPGGSGEGLSCSGAAHRERREEQVL